MKTGVEKPASGIVAGGFGLLPLASRSASFLVSAVAILQGSPIRYRLSLLRERPQPVAGHRAPPPRESYRRGLVNVSIVAQPSRTAGLGYV